MVSNSVQSVFNKYYPHFIQIFVRLSSLIISFGINILIIRKFTYGVEYFGRYASITAFIALLVSGVFSAINFNYLRSGKFEDFIDAVKNNLKIYLIATPILVGLGYLSGYLPLEIIIIASTIMATSLVEIISSYYRFCEKDGKILLFKISYQVIVLLLFLLLPINKFTIFILVYFIAFIIPLFFFFTGKRLKKFKVSKAEFSIYAFFSKSKYLIFSSSVGLIYSQADIYLLNIIRGDNASGVYRIASMMSGVFYSVIATTTTVYLSQNVKFGADNPTNNLLPLYNRFKKYLTFNLIIGLGYVLFAFVFNKHLIILAFALKAKDAILPSYIMSISCLFNLLATVCSYTLIYFKKEAILLKVTLPAAVLGLLLNYILISKYSYIGAACASLTINMFICFGLLFFSKKQFNSQMMA